MHYWTPDGRQILDAVAGLWCVNAGHGRKEITEAVSAADRDDGIRAAVPDGTPGGVPAGERRGRLAAAGPRPRLLHQLRLGVGRHRAEDRAGLSPRPRRGTAHAASSAASAATTASASAAFRSAAWSTTASGSARCCRASTTCRTRTTSRTTPTRAASPSTARNLADELERLVALHDASNIAAVIVEPVAGSTGVLIPPKGYLRAPARASARSTASC